MTFKRLLRTCGILILLTLVFMTLEPARAEEEHTSVEKNESGENGNSEAKAVNDESDANEIYMGEERNATSENANSEAKDANDKGNANEGKSGEESNASEENNINVRIDGNGMNYSEEQISNLETLHNLSSRFIEHIVKLETDIQGLKDNGTSFLEHLKTLQNVNKHENSIRVIENEIKTVKDTQTTLRHLIENEMKHCTDSIDLLNQRIDDHKREHALALKTIQGVIAGVQKHIFDNDIKSKQLLDDLKTSLDTKETETTAKITSVDADLKSKFELLKSRIHHSEETFLEKLAQSKEDTDRLLANARQQIFDNDIKLKQLLGGVQTSFETKIRETETKITSLDAEFKSQFEFLKFRLTASEETYFAKLTQSRKETDRDIRTAKEEMHADMENRHGELKTEMDTIRNLLKQEIGHVFSNVSQHKALLDIIYPNTFHRGCTQVMPLSHYDHESQE